MYIYIYICIAIYAGALEKQAPYYINRTMHLGESLRGNRIGATGPRASEREVASERVFEREVFRVFSEVFRGS